MLPRTLKVFGTWKLKLQGYKMSWVNIRAYANSSLSKGISINVNEV